MNTNVTPGRLALWGLAGVILGAIFAAIFSSMDSDVRSDAATLFQVLSFFFYGAGAVLLIGAGIAKVVQIGVRSSRD